MERAKFPMCTLIELISERQAKLEKTDEQLAQDLGLAEGNAITRLKEGKFRLSSAHLSAVAIALNIPAAYVFRAALSDMASEVVAGFDTLWDYMAITADEERLVDAYRALVDSGREPVTVTLPGAIAVVIPEPRKTAG